MERTGIHIQRSHTAAARGGYSLSVHFILYVAGGKNTFDIGFGCAGNCFDITGLVHIEPGFKNIAVGLVTDRNDLDDQLFGTFSQAEKLLRRALAGWRHPVRALAMALAAFALSWGVALGEALAGQTLFWVGERFGFGFYRAGQVSVAFVFDAGRAGLKDTVRLPFLGGQLIDASCTFGGNRAWVLLASERAGRRVHQCVVVSAEGVVEAAAEADEGDGSWLGNLQGKCAAGASLLSATDSGLVRIELSQGALVETRRFPDTEPFLDQNSRLLAGPTGLYVIEPREIKLLKIS